MFFTVNFVENISLIFKEEMRIYKNKKMKFLIIIRRKKERKKERTILYHSKD